jgi:hypothetical protein
LPVTNNQPVIVDEIYYVTLTNKRNTRYQSSDTAKFRVTTPPKKPVITADLPSYSSVGTSLTISIDTTQKFDTVEIKWYEVPDPTAGGNIDTE